MARFHTGVFVLESFDGLGLEPRKQAYYLAKGVVKTLPIDNNSYFQDLVAWLNRLAAKQMQCRQ